MVFWGTPGIYISCQSSQNLDRIGAKTLRNMCIKRAVPYHLINQLYTLKHITAESMSAHGIDNQVASYN